VFLALRVVTFAMMFCGGAMGLCRVLVMLGCLIVFVLGHWIFLQVDISDQFKSQILAALHKRVDITLGLRLIEAIFRHEPRTGRHCS
jgi:hypothetical protein